MNVNLMCVTVNSHNLLRLHITLHYWRQKCRSRPEIA